MTTETSARDVGVPVKGVCWVKLHPGRRRDGSPSLLVNFGQNLGGMFVCDIDLATGHCRQFPTAVKGEDYPIAAFRSPTTGLLYLGTHPVGHLQRFDPEHPERGLEDLGVIHEELCNFPCRIDEAPDGALWIGGYSGASLTRYDPRTREFKRFGRMDETDQYFYPLCGVDGTIAGLVKMCRIHVVMLDPKTGEHRSVGPVVDTDANSGGGEKPSIDLIKGVDGLLYIKSSEGNFRLSGMTATPIAALPAEKPAPTLPGGATVAFTDEAAQQFRSLKITSPDKGERMLTLDWEGGGSNLYLVRGGPDGRVYGSSVLPLHLFRCEADGAGLVDLGQCTVAMGEIYSMGNLDGKLYAASYPGARLTVYDPAKPYRFGEEDGANPRDLGRVDQVAYRPSAMLTGPAGKVWVGSNPDYGMWGGTLASYDPRSGKFSSHRHVVQDCSVTALEWLPELNQILVGTGIEGGSGTQPRASEAGFVFWDPHADRAVAAESFGLRGIERVYDIKRDKMGTLYAIVKLRTEVAGSKPVQTCELMKLDPNGRRVLERSPFEGDEHWPIGHVGTLCAGPDGVLYGSTSARLYRIIPGTVRREAVWCSTGREDNITAPGAIVGRRYYFASEHRLRCIDIS